jgi:ADP-heptose:LPS heptosyltransferase
VAPRVLIADSGQLGDVLLTLPAATALRSVLPHGQIAFLAAAPFAGVPRECPMSTRSSRSPVRG